MKSALSSKVLDQDLIVFDALNLEGAQDEGDGQGAERGST